MKEESGVRVPPIGRGPNDVLHYFKFDFNTTIP